MSSKRPLIRGTKKTCKLLLTDRPVLNLEVDMTINKLASEVDLVTPPVRPTEP